MTDTETAVRTLINNWPYAFQDPSKNEQLRTLLTAFGEDVALTQRTITELYENRFIETATGSELAKLGAAVGVTRRAGEDDTAFRYRIRLAMAAASSDGTASDIAAMIDTAFGADAFDNIEVGVATDTPELLFLIPPQRIDGVPVSKQRVSERINDAMPAGTGAQVISDNDVFTFRSDATNAESYEAGFDEGVWTR